MAKKKSVKKKLKKENNALAIVGFSLSFLGLFSIMGIIFSSIALFQINKKKQKGKDLAKAGLIVGIFVFLGSALILIGVLFFIKGPINSFILEGPGELALKDYNLTGFKKIEMRGKGNLYLTQGENYSVQIEAGKNILKNLQVHVIEDFLIIEKDLDLLFSNESEIKVYITMPEVEYLSLAGDGDILGKTKINSESLNLFIFGSGDMNLEIKTNNLKSGIFGSGDVILKGETEKAFISIIGSGDCKMKEFKTKESQINIEGSGDVELQVSKKLDVEIAGSGNVVYYGNPEVEESIYGSGSLKNIN